MMAAMGEGMALPPERANEPEWLVVQRRRRREESASGSAALSATALAALPYGLVQIAFKSTYTDGTLLGVALVLLGVLVFAFRRSARGTFARAFAAWSIPIHAAFVAVLLAIMVH
jgi:hypothetical protein